MNRYNFWLYMFPILIGGSQIWGSIKYNLQAEMEQQPE